MNKETIRMQMLAGIITESQYKKLLEDMEVVNRILDKISSQGKDSLTPGEKEYLDKYSRGEENIPEPSQDEVINWDWHKARIMSEDDDDVVYKVWGEGKLYNYYGNFSLPYDDDRSTYDIEDKNTREEFGSFTYISKWTKDTDELVDEIYP